MELERLIVRIAGGDQEALAELYNATRVKVFAAALGCTGSHQDAQDVTQDTYVKIWESASSYRPQGTPLAWIITIARNLAGMKIRSGKKQTFLEEEEWNALPGQSQDISPEDREMLQDAMKRLSPEERQVVLLHTAGFKHRETASFLNIPLSTVLSKYRRALKKMRACMEGDGTHDK